MSVTPNPVLESPDPSKTNVFDPSKSIIRRKVKKHLFDLHPRDEALYNSYGEPLSPNRCFRYAAATRIVPVHVYNLDNPADHLSEYYSTTILAGLFVTVISSFTPAAKEAAAMGWAQTVLGKNLPFLPTSPKYAVPVPLGFEMNALVCYLTDVIIMNPVCDWAIPNPPASIFTDPITSLQSINTLPTHSITTEYTLLNNWKRNKSVDIVTRSSLGLNFNVFTNTTRRL
ncbi:hypothetical protein L218DRAFT_998722 [Marasmius fiardii PR-910]|nr:hypothetical protein L218DRAFT_998722 [Marasmius fiardii PR-910]